MYQALPSYLTIKESTIHGLGLFAKEDIPKNTLLGLTHIKYQNVEDNYIRTPIGGFYNHSNNPNCYSHFSNELLEIYQGSVVAFNNNHNIENPQYRYLVSIRDIQKGEEITSTYNLYKIK